MSEKKCLTHGCNNCRACMAPEDPLKPPINHTVFTDALATLGTILDSTAERDAIHLAVEPVIAGMKLLPGDRIKLDADGRAIRAYQNDAIGVVDPFLEDFVQEGQRFWLVVLPRTITSLRHVWEHPAFEPSELMRNVAPKLGPSVEASRAWILNFVANSNCPSYDDLISAILDPSDTWDDEYLHFIGQNASGNIPDELYDHVGIVTGRKVPGRPKYFSCSC